MPAAERAVLRSVAHVLRGARRSPVPGVAVAAAGWERRFGFLVRLRLMDAQKRRTLEGGGR